MNKTPMIMACTVLVIALTVPAIAGSPVTKVSKRVYKGSSTVLVDTEGHLTGIMRNTFGLFNPVLDLVKGCTGVVLSPVELPFAVMAKATAKPKLYRTKGNRKVPVPKKPKIPAK